MSDLDTKINIPAPNVMAQITEDGLYVKATKPKGQVFMLALTGGAYIALGFIFYVTSQQGMSAWPVGYAKVLGGLCFSAGLIAVILSGSDLFTGTTMTLMPWLSKRLSTAQVLSHWVTSYVGNLVGSVLMAVIILLAGTPFTNKGAWGLVVMNVANSKVHHTWVQALFLGLLANFAVCIAVWLANSGRTTWDKMAAIFPPIALFVASGFEHSVANMFMLPMGLLIKHFGGDTFWASQAVQDAGKTLADYDGLTVGTAIWNNLIPVTLGNIIGGGVFVGMYWWVCYIKKWDKK